MEDDAPTLKLRDEDGRTLLCQVERSLQADGKDYVLLLPVHAPIEIFAWTEDEDSDEDEMLIDIDEEEIDEVFSTARAVLAEQDLVLERSALTLTAAGELPEVGEEDIIALDLDESEEQENVEEFQQLASFFYEEQEYVICTPLDPLLFFAQIKPDGEPQLLSMEELQYLLSLEEFQTIRAELEYESQLDEVEN